MVLWNRSGMKCVQAKFSSVRQALSATTLYRINPSTDVNIRNKFSRQIAHAHQIDPHHVLLTYERTIHVLVFHR